MKRRAANKEYVPVQTGFCTKFGPAVDTWWVNPTYGIPMLRVTKCERGWVHFGDNGDRGSKLSVKTFLEQVKTGYMILVGVKPHNLSVTEF